MDIISDSNEIQTSNPPGQHWSSLTDSFSTTTLHFPPTHINNSLNPLPNDHRNYHFSNCSFFKINVFDKYTFSLNILLKSSKYCTHMYLKHFLAT